MFVALSIWLRVVSAENGLTYNIIDFQSPKIGSYMNPGRKCHFDIKDKTMVNKVVRRFMKFQM